MKKIFVMVPAIQNGKNFYFNMKNGVLSNTKGKADKYMDTFSFLINIFFQIDCYNRAMDMNFSCKK